MNIIVHKTPTCPKCKVLLLKLDKAGLEYTIDEDVDTMAARGIKSVPKMEVDGVMYDFKEAVDWVNAKGGLTNGSN